MNKINFIKGLASRFRQAIEDMDVNNFQDSDWFGDFPRGCCGDTSELLSKFLKDHGVETLYICGCDGWQTHAWLEHDDIIIDITADQFPHIQEKVIITQNRSWHSNFKIQSKHEIDYGNFNDSYSDRLSTIYYNIIKHLT